MKKKETNAMWTGGAIGLGIALVLAWPAIGSLMEYYKADSTRKTTIRGVFDAIKAK